MKPLVLLPSLKATVSPDGRVGLTGKFISGVEAYASAWDGPVQVLIEPMPGASENLDNELVDPSTLPFELEVIDYDDPALETALRSAGVVHGILGYRQNSIPSRCRAWGVPFVTGSEYTLATRKQIVRANTSNPIKRLRRELWEHNQERANRAAVRAAAGIQCNGTPTYEAYRSLNASPMLYFDTRTHADEVLDREALERRLERVLDGSPLRLAFSGRLDPMKGADHLVPFARALHDLGTKFTFVICGDGTLGSDVRRASQSVAEVDMRGVLDFHSELLPLMRADVDLFVCPHVQGDPSCTYMETMACGVPMAGFGNEAFQGIYDRAAVGWVTPLGDPRALARQVAQIDQQRILLAERSRIALALAREHTYEATFARRVEHLAAHAR